jgi:predicted outer membrane repeat protein
MRVSVFACLFLSLAHARVAVSEPTTTTSSFTCVSSGDQGGSCFVASCAQLHAAVNAGVSHVTLYRNLTAGVDDRCSFPLRVARPLTVRGACGEGTGKCLISGGGVLARRDRNACRQKCTTCSNSAGPLFDVREGGHLTLANLELVGGCNAKDGAGGAVVVRGVSEVENENCVRKPIENVFDRTSAASWTDADEANRVVRDLEDEINVQEFSAATTKTSVKRKKPHKKASASLVAVGVTFAENLVTGGSVRTGGSELGVREYASHGAPWNGRGGAVAVFGNAASATFVSCAFLGNEAWGNASVALSDAYGADVGEGGAIFVSSGRAFVSGSRFENNVAEKEGGAVYAEAGAFVKITATSFDGNVVTDDYWDGGGGVFLGGLGTTAEIDVTRFAKNSVTEYPDARRRALTCGGGGLSVTRGASVTLNYALFENNRAPRGGAVCAHDASVSFRGAGAGASAGAAVFRGNSARHAWFGKPPGNDIECVQCFKARLEANGGFESTYETGAYTYETSPSACAYLTDADAAGSRGGSGLPACAPPPGAFPRSGGNSDPAFADEIDGFADGRSETRVSGTTPEKRLGASSPAAAAYGYSGSSEDERYATLESAFAAAARSAAGLPEDIAEDSIFVAAAGDRVGDAGRTTARAKDEGSF